MTKVTPFLEEVIYLVADLLTSLEHNREAEKLKNKFQMPEWVQKDNPLIKKGLKKIIKEYVNSNQKILKYYQNRKPEPESEQSELEQKPFKKITKSLSPQIKPQSPQSKFAANPVNAVNKQPRKWITQQFESPKRLEDLNYADHQVSKKKLQIISLEKNKKQFKRKSSSEENSSPEPTQKTKKEAKQIKKLNKQQKDKKQTQEKKKRKVKGPVDSSNLNSEEEFELEGSKVKEAATPEKPQKKEEQKNNKKKQENLQKVKTQEQISNHNKNQGKIQTNNYSNESKKFFSRINSEELGHIPEQRRDNSFEAKSKYGAQAGDAWGQFGYDRLKDARGESFKKTKGKLKNKAFQGSGINMHQINSIPIL